MRCFWVLASLSILSVSASGASKPLSEQQPEPQYFTLPPLREQASIQDNWVKERREGIPKLLRKYGVDAWLVSQREYAEETVFWSLKSAKEFSARRRTTLLFFADVPDKKSSNSYKWVDNTPSLWAEIRAALSAHGAKKIALDIHPEISFSSGLHAGELQAVRDGLGPEWASRFVSKPMLAVEYIATMPEGRAEWYHRLQSTAWAMISEAFSERVIQPGVTSTTDVEWWLREKLQQMNYTTWFHPDVSIIDEGAWKLSVTDRRSEEVINYGDMLHVDFGVSALGMNTDTQHLAYVLHPGDTDDRVPKGLQDGLRKGNRAQDIVVSNMKIGKTGNEILKASLAQMQREGIEGRVYCHPIGDWGHSAGTLIGMVNLQDKVPILGDLPLLPNTYYSIELLVNHFVPELNTTLTFPLEEDVVWDRSAGGKDLESPWKWAFARQSHFHLVRTPSGGSAESRAAAVDSQGRRDL
ncbi:hypothetical protein B0T16DRAFT_457264 [Cercophora newfieldiana]|uniref:Peptidase M24 domain-containing protein n=1 Tax=Cercophora newfieldiana TaxID=92897 RepID=A0AA39YE84_9PEZI|nr:hypothetical protein B0T16DRAFT_457264 [Cercophora newfieldiana]